MSIYKVREKTEQRLLAEPESGMGYQVVIYRQQTLIIFNATSAISLDELRGKAFSEHDYEFLSGNPTKKVPIETEPLDLADKFRVVFSIFDGKYRTEGVGLNFSEQIIRPSPSAVPVKIPQSYFRYSAYSRDKRVRPGSGDFLPGTYATTYPDIHFVPSGFAAVGRYALPNPASARFVFPIVTFDRPNLMGTATPNFGQAGGGVEVLFSRGARNGPGNSFPIVVG